MSNEILLGIEEKHLTTDSTSKYLKLSIGTLLFLPRKD